MANQMTPDELRAAAKRVHVSEPFYAEACRRLADVIEYAESERERLLRIPAGSMYAQGQYDLNDVVLRIARGDTTNENRSADG